MKVDGELPMGMNKITDRIGQMVEAGYTGAQTVETGHDPFLPLVLAAEHSRNIDLITAIAVAFARNPMNLAAIGNDLNAYSEGRFILGLGSQIRAHIEKRFSMPWSKPAARMREMIEAMRAIWANWYDGEGRTTQSRCATSPERTDPFQSLAGCVREGSAPRSAGAPACHRRDPPPPGSSSDRRRQ